MRNSKKKDKSEIRNINKVKQRIKMKKKKVRTRRKKQITEPKKKKQEHNLAQKAYTQNKKSNK